MQRRRRAQVRAGHRHRAGRGALLVFSMFALVGCFVPVGAATPGAAAGASSTAATGTPALSVGSTLIPRTMAAAPGAEPSGPLIVTLQPIHPPTSTPPRPNTGTTAPPTLLSGTPRARGATATRTIASPVRGAATRAGRSPTVAPVRAIIPVAPIAPTPIPTPALPPTSVPTAMGGSDSASATPNQLPLALSPIPAAPTEAPMPTPVSGADTLPTVALATPGSDISGASPVETTLANPPAPLLAPGGIGGIIALAVFVLVLGAIGVVSGVVTLVRGRHA